MITFHLPVKFFIDSIDYAWDRSGVLFLAVQTNDPTHIAGCAVFQQQWNGTFAEVLATGPAGWSKGKLKMRSDGTGWLVACAEDRSVNFWQVPAWKSAP